MVQWATSLDLSGVRVLEIGGGIGALQAEILQSGADRGEIVELVPAYEQYAYELAREKGLDGRVSYHVADILESSNAVREADVVVLNRVVCCSPDGIELAAAAARLARRGLLLSFPRDVVWTRAVVHLMNAGFWLMRWSFRTFVHPIAKLVAAAEADGLRLVDRGRSSIWEFAAFERQ